MPQLINVAREALGDFRATIVEQAMTGVAVDSMLRSGMMVAEVADHLERQAADGWG